MSLQRLTCESETGKAVVHICNPCSDKELGRVRSVILASSAFDRDAFKAALKKGDGSAFEILETAVAEGSAHLISETTGTYNGGEPEYGDGYGDETQRLRSRNHELAFNDPSYAENEEFYAEVEKSHWYPIFRTEKLLHFADKPATVVATDPVEADLNSDVTWNVTCSWKSKNKASVVPIDDKIKDIFDGCWGATV